MGFGLYFPKKEWESIKRAEIIDDEGNKILKYYSDIYKEKFFGENQDSKKEFINDPAYKFKSNEKEKITFSENRPIKLKDFEIKMLTM